MQKIDVMPDASEVMHYDRPDIPLYNKRCFLSDYPDMRGICHWHEDFEWIKILDGEMNYFIDGTNVRLQKNDCLLVNARQMHYGYSERRQECVFLCVLIHPSLLTGNAALRRDMIGELTGRRDVPFLYLAAENEDAAPIRKGLDTLLREKEAGAEAYELSAVGILTALLAQVLRLLGPAEATESFDDSRLTAHRRMVAYISAHYAEPITLEEIAESASVSKSTCCRIFKEYAQETPFEFLTAYRLHVSLDLLENTGKSITEIAGLCGFNHTSYYSHLFARSYGTQPHQYRRTHRS